MLPFLNAEDDIHINLCIVLIIIGTLETTNRGTLKINNGRLHIFLFLIKNPTALNKLFGLLGKGTVSLHERDAFSIASISPNIDPLFDRAALKSLLSILVSKQLISVIYKKNDGFFYILSESGKIIISGLQDDYLLEVQQLCRRLKPILSTSEPNLNQHLNQLFRTGSI